MRVSVANGFGERKGARARREHVRGPNTVAAPSAITWAAEQTAIHHSIWTITHCGYPILRGQFPGTACGLAQVIS
jgi:hypothetical protein